MLFANVYPISAPPRREFHRTQSGGPPSEPPSIPAMGNYCIRASTQITDATDTPMFDVVGYSPNLQIADEVTEVCERKAKILGEEASCDPTKLFFMGPRDQCNSIEITSSSSS